MELLSPAGSREALIAAVQNGADAVYLGFGGFNARRNAGNFDGPEFEDAVKYCHLHGVRVHVTLNTLVKESEMQGFLDAAYEAACAGADAVIVQDLGGAHMIKELYPDMKLHMSTQTACCNAAGVRFAASQGYDRVVLARECSMAEIALCARQGVEIETFVHGALCVCFSGQCLFSSMVGGRSGNRGLCAQPCRLDYELSGAEPNRTQAKGCLLSTRDMMLLGRLPELERSGVCSLKIEGRLKRPEYVAEVTRVYRRALDMLAKHPERFEPDAMDEQALRQIFNRGGFSQAYLDANFYDRAITDISRPNNMGVRVGRLISARSGNLKMQLSVPLDAGDQISLRHSAAEAGFELRQALAQGDAALPMPPSLRLSENFDGAGIYRAASRRQLEHARNSCAGEHRPLKVRMYAKIKAGRRAWLEISAAAEAQGDIAGVRVSCEGDMPSPARQAALKSAEVCARLAKLGGTSLEAAQCTLELDEGLFMPVAALNALRRQAADKFIDAILSKRRGCHMPDKARIRPLPAERLAASEDHAPLLIVQSRALSDAALGDVLYWTPEHVDRQSLEASFGAGVGGKVYLRFPNMLNSAELEDMAEFALAHSDALAGCVITNISQLEYELSGELVGDMNLNIWNSRSAEILRIRGVKRLTAPLELTAGEIGAEDWRGMERELIIYGRAELMTLRHCPLNALNGRTHAACRLCDAGRGLEGRTLTDRRHAQFPLMRYRGESGCYVELLNSAPHDLIGRLGRLPACEAVRLIFTDEAEAARRRISREAKAAVADLAAGRRISHEAASGSTTGHYFRGVD